MKIEVRIKEHDEYRCVDVLKRDYIEKIYKTINTRKIAIETIKNSYMWHNKSGRYYANLDVALGEIIYTSSIYDTEVLIPLFSIYIEIEDRENSTIDEMYYDFMDSAEFYFEDFDKKLDKIYSQDFRKCELCGGVEDNIKVDENYFDENIDRYKDTAILKEYRCRSCNNERGVLFV